MKAYFSFLYLKTKCQINRKIDDFYLWFVWKIPQRLVYWCGIRMGAHATTGIYGNDNVGEVTIMDVLKRWENRYEKKAESQETFVPNMQTIQDGLGDSLEEQRVTPNQIGREGDTRSSEERWR